MKNVFLKIFLILCTAVLFAGCSDDKGEGVPAGPGTPGAPGQGSGFVFQTVKFGYDYLGTSPVINVTYWQNEDIVEQMIKDAVARHNLPESQEESANCAAYDGQQNGQRPDIANMRVCFQKVCSEVPGYNFELWIVRMHVLTEINSDKCQDSKRIHEVYDFWENATAINSQFLIRSESPEEGSDIGFDPFAVNLQVLDNGETLQGALGAKILPPSRFNNVKYSLQHDYRSYCQSEQPTPEQCGTSGVPKQEPKKEVIVAPPENPTPPEEPCYENPYPSREVYIPVAPTSPRPNGVIFVPDRSCHSGSISGIGDSDRNRRFRRTRPTAIRNHNIGSGMDQQRGGEKKQDLLGDILYDLGTVIAGDPENRYGKREERSSKQVVSQDDLSQTASIGQTRTITHGYGDSEERYKNEFNKAATRTMPLPHSSVDGYEVGSGSLGRTGNLNSPKRPAVHTADQNRESTKNSGPPYDTREPYGPDAPRVNPPYQPRGTQSK